MTTYIIYFIVFFILTFVLVIAVKAISRGIEAKERNKEEKVLNDEEFKKAKEKILK